MWAERTALSLMPRTPKVTSGRILCYHSVGTPEWGVNDVSPKRFRRQIEGLARGGYRFVPAEEIAAGRSTPRDIAVTFDDNLASVAINAAPLLFDLKIPWTLFVVSDWADGRHGFASNTFLGWREIERLAARGATIGSHSVTHPDFARLSDTEVDHELIWSRRTIEERLGLRPTAFAIPLGQRRNWTATAQAAAASAGYRTVYAQAAATRHAGTAPRTFITRYDNDRLFAAALRGAYDGWEEWV
jgi:peptidoglycan/xylan/chitin deacetylase (PgdA/CDA1 family)